MSKITLSSPLASQFLGQQGALELCDDAGQTIGYFLPVAEHQRIQNLEAEQRRLYAWAQAQFTEEELAHAEQETEEYTLAEALQRLERR